MKKRIIIITTVDYSVKHIKDIINSLDNYEVILVTGKAKMGGINNLNQNIKRVEIKMKRKPSVINDLLALIEILLILIKEKPDIVFSYTPKANLLGMLACSIARTKIRIISVFGVPQINMLGIYKKIYDIFLLISCRLANIVWCDSRSIRSYLITNKLCIKNKAVVFGYGSVCGVDPKIYSRERFQIHEINKAKKRNGISNKAFVVGFVGRICKDKGIEDLIEAWTRINKCQREMCLILVGPFDYDDPINSKYYEIIKNDRSIQIIGIVEDTPIYYALMDIFILPSYREGFGLVNIEASAMELPVIATRILGCIDSVIDGTTGILIEPHAVSEIQEKIDYYYNQPEVRYEHGRNGREIVLQRFNPNNIITEFKNQIELLLINKNSSIRK